MKSRLLIIILVISFVSIFPISQVFGIGTPPPERVPVSVWGIYDLQGNKLELVQAGEQIQIVSDLANAQDTEQSLAYIVEVYDKDENQVYRNWIEATLGPMDSFSPAISWVTETPGYYTAKIMVWEALDNSSSLSPALESEFYVVGDISVLNENKSCSEGKELVFKINYKKISCVFPETLVKLLARGWANWHDWYSPLFIDNLRQGPQDVDEVHAEFVKREVMKDSKVAKYFLHLKNFDYTCCSYLYNDDDEPSKYHLVINFSDLPNDKQLVVVYDLRQTKVVETNLKDMIQLGGPIISEPKLIPKDDVKSTQEHYEIEIIGLKDVYLVGERYDFSYILSGYGNSCGSKKISFPDQNGDSMTIASSASCIANLPMEMFVFDIQKEQGTTFGHIVIENPGTYTVTVTFDRPSQYFPTTVSKEFRIMEN